MKFTSLILAAMLGSTQAVTLERGNRFHPQYLSQGQSDRLPIHQFSQKRPAAGSDTEKSMNFIMSKIDKNGDNAVEESELEYLYSFLANEYGYTMTSADKQYVNKFFMQLDTNGDNKVTADEFFTAYNKGECDEFLNGPWMHMKNKKGTYGIPHNWDSLYSLII